MKILNLFKKVRQASLDMVEPLALEDYRIQTMAEVSPPWWNIGHTSWFFSKNILEPYGRGHDIDRQLEYVLNSYYNVHGDRVQQKDRGKLSRPTNDEIKSFRASVDQRMLELIEGKAEQDQKLRDLVFVGLQHEQQHQELFFTEIKHIYFQNPLKLRPIYQQNERRSDSSTVTTQWVEIPGGTHEIGCADENWGWDNEKPRHGFLSQKFLIADHLVTNGEYLEFMESDGYARPEYWLDNGYRRAQELGWHAPLYWEKDGSGNWTEWTLRGQEKLDLNQPVCHVSFYEADAYARFKQARLPTEQEWEIAATSKHATSLKQLVNHAWQWTASNYRPYPGYQSFQGALSEYNGKFMDLQYVLRGGSEFTPADHIRKTYRNFWGPETRFQLSGVRLVKE